MITGILIGIGIALYFGGAVAFLFIAAAGGAPAFGLLLGISWPIMVPYLLIRSKIQQHRWRKEKQ